jgi:DNA-binding Xre family transcriptional regulator
LAISYKKLWKLMIDHDMNKTQLRKEAGLSTNVLAKLSKNDSVSMDSLMRICRVLRCDVGDIVEVVDDADQPHITEYHIGDKSNQLRVAENTSGGYNRE